MSSGRFTMMPGLSNELVDPQSFLPGGGNYRELCQDCKVVQCIPNYANPTKCMMTCKCPKVMPNGMTKYYPAIITYDVRESLVSTSNDGRLYVHS
jgi:hypothetical protein